MDETIIGVVSAYDKCKYDFITEIVGCFLTMDEAREACQDYLDDFKKEITTEYGEYYESFIVFDIQYKICKLPKLKIPELKRSKAEMNVEIKEDVKYFDLLKYNYNV